MGIDVDTEARDALLNARSTNPDKWDKQTAVGILSALTSLSQKLRPVTAETLKECEVQRSYHDTMSYYKRVSSLLAPVILFFSLATFITSGISKAIDADIERGNALAVTLGDQI